MANLLLTSSTDPFTAVYCSLWDMLENHTGFADLVSPPNRIKFLGGILKPTKELITDTDLPELIVEPTGGDPHLENTSSTSRFVMAFNLLASTGNQRLDTPADSAGMNAAIFPVLWEMFRAMIGWSSIVKSIEWNGRPCVYLARPKSLAISLTAQDQNRTIVGWSATIGYEVGLNFLTSDMAPTPPALQE